MMSGIQARQAEARKEHGEWLVSHTRALAEFDRKMIEIEDKLNGLIGFVAGQPPKPDRL